MVIKRKVALIVAHPDDEILWAGGTILMHPQWDLQIYSLCRGEDPDRSVKFFKVLKQLGAVGAMANMNDDPEQNPLDEDKIRLIILSWLANKKFDLLITHGLQGEYSRHLRHEETSRAVTKLWLEGKIKAQELWHFAYEDGQGIYRPKAIKEADLINKLPREIWQKKHKIITTLYDFSPQSWEAKTTPKTEAFWQYHSSVEFKYKQHHYESIGTI